MHQNKEIDLIQTMGMEEAEIARAMYYQWVRGLRDLEAIKAMPNIITIIILEIKGAHTISLRIQKLSVD